MDFLALCGIAFFIGCDTLVVVVGKWRDFKGVKADIDKERDRQTEGERETDRHRETHRDTQSEIER